MKKLLILLLSVLSMMAYAQQKKVAVYVTGNDPINSIMGDHLVDGIAHDGKYIAVERTASFLNELVKEQSYQQTGAVDDSELSRLGKQFGVDYVCVATPFDVWGEKYISARMIDVERAEVIATSSANGKVENSTQFVSILNTLTKGLVKSFEQSKMADAKKVAVYVTRTGNKDIDIILGDQLVAGFATSGRYLAIERTQGFLNQLSKEQAYQQTGAVDDSDLMRLGKQFGVQYVCIAKTTSLFGEYFIVARLIDVESGEVVNSHKIGAVQLNSSHDIIVNAKEIATILSDRTIKEEHLDGNYVERSFGINMKMKWIEGGEFLMGCCFALNGECITDELWVDVQHVTLKGFYIGTFEVTQSQWEKVMGTSVMQQKYKYCPKCWFIPTEDPDLPMCYVSKDDAMEFCRRLSNKTGRTYTLPTEAQWEYAAGGGNKRENMRYSGSNNIDLVGWHIGNSNNELHVVGTKCANSLGLYDMTGNVEEWCEREQNKNNHITKGGSFMDNPLDIKVIYKSSCTLNNETGFRVIMIP